MTIRTSLLAVCLLCSAQAAFAAAGKVLFVAGSVNLERNATRALKVGDSLDLGDVIVTGEQSRAQLLMADGARIAMRASSRFRIDELALPSNVQQPGMAVAVASSGKSVGTLLKGGFSTRDGAIGKSNSSAFEMHTPIGTLGIRGTYYTAVFCRGDCTDAPGLPAGQPIPDGLYLAVDEGTITFDGRGLALVLTAPRFEFIPLETSDPQQLTDPPSFLRNDGAGALQVAGRVVRIAANDGGELQKFNDRRSPNDGDSPAAIELTQTEQGQKRPEQQVEATSPLGRTVDFTDPVLPIPQQTSVAAVVPATSGQASFGTSATELSSTLAYNGADSLIQFDAPSGAGAAAAMGTYVSGTAALVDAGSNGASGIHWGRWATGLASINTLGGVQTLDLANASLHWITGPSFELVPTLPVSGSTSFILAGGTSPTDTSGHAGALSGAVLSADFTAQQVSTTLSLDVNGYNWFASGTGSIAAGTVRFGGNFSAVRVDGRVPGSGSFSGFFSAGATTPDQLNGAGLSYVLTDSLQQLGTVSGVMGFIPGTVQTSTPPVVQQDLAYSTGTLIQTDLVGAPTTDTDAQLARDANGDLAAFVAPLPAGASGTLQIGTASVANAGSDAATGLRWGRWEAGIANVTTAGATQPSDLSSEALHWIIGTGFGAAPALPQTGAAGYTLVGNTDPTDQSTNVGTLAAASFSADFTNRIVTSALSVNIAGNSWFASGTGTFTAGSRLFSGTYDQGGINNLIRTNGHFSGFFTVPRFGGGSVDGVGLAYNIQGNLPGPGIVSGVAAFEQGPDAPLTPPALQQRDIAATVPAPGPSAVVFTTAPTDYAVDTEFNLTKLLGLDNSDPPAPTAYDIGTSSVVESGADALLMLRWGRWSGGMVNVTNLSSGQASTLDLSQSSLHWVESADAAKPPVIPTSGVASYQLAAWTTPTDRAGNSGTLNSATFDANFTTQTVASKLNLTINTLNWTVNGQGVIGAQAGLPAHQFAGSYATGTINPIQDTATGSFSGFFSSPGGKTPGVPGGVGLTYTLRDGQGLSSVDGAVVFRGP